MYGDPKKNILIIDFYHSTGNVGGLRWRKFAKYLPESGINPIILTSGDPKDDTDNVFHFPFTFCFTPSHGFAYGRDDSFWGRFKRFVRGNLFIPDPRRLWFCYGLAKALVKRFRVSVVITTGPPHSVHLTGLRLKRKLGVKWIADFRDPWMPYYFNMLYLTYPAKWLQYRIASNVVYNADMIFAVEENLIPGFLPELIPNGFDPDDFQGTVEPGEHLMYVGSLSDRKLLPDIYYRHVHNLPHDRAIKLMRQAKALLVCYPADVIPSKIYEYMASGRPIISFGIAGKGVNLIWKSRTGIHFTLELANNLHKAGTLIGFIDNWLKSINPVQSEIQKYNVQEITKEVARLIYYLNGV